VSAAFDPLKSTKITVVNADTITDPVIVTPTVTPTPEPLNCSDGTYYDSAYHVCRVIPTPTPTSTPTPTPSSTPTTNEASSIELEDYDKKMAEVIISLSNTISYYNTYCRGNEWALDYAISKYNSLQQAIDFLIANSNNMEGAIIDPETIIHYQASSNTANATELSLYLDYHANLTNDAKYYLQRAMVHFRNDRLTGSSTYTEAEKYYGLYQQSLGKIIEECSVYGNKLK